MSNNITAVINSTADKAELALKDNSVFGDPIVIDNVTIIPVYKLSFGFGGGGFDRTSSNKDAVAGGAGAGVTKKPVSYITVKDGEISVLSAEDSSNNSLITKAFSIIKNFKKKE